MNRTEFLKILGATPFAIKALITEKRVDKPIEKELVKNKAYGKNYFLFKHRGKEFGISNHGSIHVSHDHLYGVVSKKDVEIEFEEMRVLNGYDMPSLFDSRATIEVEIYDHNTDQFKTAEGFLVQLESSRKRIGHSTWSGLIYVT